MYVSAQKKWPKNAANITLYQHYAISIYFAVVTMTTTGYGDISGHESFGFLVIIVTIIFGVLVFAYAVSLLTATLVNVDAPKYCHIAKFSSVFFSLSLSLSLSLCLFV